MTISNSSQPDLNWSQVRETVKLLTVSVSQVEGCMKEGDDSVNALTESFMSLVERVKSINELLNTLEPSDQKQMALNHCAETSEIIQNSIVSFQFYDRLQQSLAHVSNALKGLSELVECPERLYNPLEWTKFQQGIRDQFTMESEKVMFDAILQGKSVEEAIRLAADVNNHIDYNDIELF